MALNISEIIFIINPHSGRKKPAMIMKKLNSINPNFNIFVSDSIDAFHDFMVENIDKYKYFVVAGGDGAINLTANYLFQKDDKILGIIPIGSGNGFARETGFMTSLEKLIKQLEIGEYFEADVLEINDKKFINMAGLGFDAWVAHRFAQRKSRGLKNYVIATIISLIEFKQEKVYIKIGEKEYSSDYNMVVMANTRQFGNNACIAPHAYPSSGMVDLVMIKKIPFYYYPVVIINMFLGRIKPSKYIEYISSNENIEIETNYDKFHIDGEPVYIKEPVNLKVYKGSLNVLNMP